MHVLVIDDDPGDRRLLLRALEKRGHTTAWAATGRTGIDQMRHGGVDLVVLDLDLGIGIDGWEVARRKLTDPTIAAVLVVLVTGASPDAVAARLVEANLPEWVAEIYFKPVDVEALERMVSLAGEGV